MELWVRSQDKEKLLKVSNLFIKHNGDVDPKLHPYRVMGDKEIDLGIYKTKERALEVLNEIQEKLEPQIVLSKLGKPIAETCGGLVYVEPNEYEIKEISTCVYEMPKK